jgi:hypothetical protein
VIKPDQSQLLAGEGLRLNIYDLKDGTLVANPKKHRQTIYAMHVCLRARTFTSSVVKF